MKSYSVYLVKHTVISEAQRILGNAEPVEGSHWVRCGYRENGSPPKDDVLEGETSVTEAISKTLGEVVFLYGDPSVNGFVYEHARDGEVVRKLVWFPMLDDDWSEGWICAQGEAEAWEATMFDEKGLEAVLERERDRYEEEGQGECFEDYAKQVRSDWAAQRIEAGQRYPECDGTMGQVVERYYGVERTG